MEELFGQNYHLIVYAAFFISAVVFSFLINRLFLKFSSTLGIRNFDDGTIIRWGARSKPAMGGISFYIIFLISVASYSIFFHPEHVLYNEMFIGLLLSMALSFLVGLADDAYNTKPLLKFFIQLSCAGVFIASGIYIKIFSELWLNYLFTIVWVVGIMNSINMLDNMDGITALVAISVLISAMLMILVQEDFSNMHLIILTGVLASLLGFLYFNWYPSKIYMGDTGSQFLGAFLSCMGIIYFWNDFYAMGPVAVSEQFIVTLLAFALPIIDTTVVVINRLWEGRSPFIGGKDHTTHSLAYFGLSDKQVAIVFSFLSAISVLLIYCIKNLIVEWSHVHTLLFSLYFIALLSFFFYTTRHKRSSSGAFQSSDIASELEPTHH
jgi:UDP-GlcNAc:undecaprenyl-phosphate GlcNAc-1-phosphate transferase